MNVFETHKKIILGSASPRRQDMLRQLGLDLEVCCPQIIEQKTPDESPVDYVRRNCLEKSEWVFQHLQPSDPSLIISADTVVVHEGQVLEKPSSAEEAISVLSKLSASKHEVVSGFCVLDVDGWIQNRILHHEVTDVYFAPLSQKDIEFYVGTGEPMDKAGSYGIQGIGGFLVDRIDGSYSNVVGLPLQQLIQAVRQLNTGVGK